MRSPFDSDRSIIRQAAAHASSSPFGYHLNGTETFSARYPRRVSAATRPRTCASAPPLTNGTCASQTRTVLALTWLRGEPEIDDVAVLHDVFLALEPHLAVVAAGGHRAARNERIVADDLRPDEAPRDVAVNLARGELRGRLARDRPGAAFVFADGEERHVAEQIVGGANHAVQTRLGQTRVAEKGGCSRGIELRDLELDFRADGARRGRGAREERRQPGRLRCGVETLRQVGFVEVDDNQQRF